MANQDLPHTRPVLCGTLYYYTTGCVVQYSIPVVQQYRCRVGVQYSRQYYLPTVYSIVVWYSIVHSMYVYTISIVYSIVHSMYVCIIVCVVVLVLLCARASLLGQAAAYLPDVLALPTYSLCVLPPPTQYSNLLVLVCVQYSMCVLTQIDRCVSQYIVQQVCCVVHSYCIRVDRQCSSSMCSAHIDSIITYTRQDRYSIVHSVVCVQ